MTDPHAPTPGTENEPGIDYDAIEKLAKAATPGPWVATAGLDERSCRVESKHWTDEDPGVCGNHSRHWPLEWDDAEFIAHCDPDSVLALVRKTRQRDAAEREIEAQIAEWQADREGLTPKGATDRAFANMIHGAEIALSALRREK